MIGLIVILLAIIAELVLLAVYRQAWLKMGLIVSIIFGILSSILLIFLLSKGGRDNLMLNSFFIMNMVLPVLFSIEIHLSLGKKIKIN